MKKNQIWNHLFPIVLAAILSAELFLPSAAYALPLKGQEPGPVNPPAEVDVSELSPEEYAAWKAEIAAAGSENTEEVLPDGAAEDAAAANAAVTSGYIGNSYIKCYVNYDGVFNIGTVDNDYLLYQFPTGTTSETLIRINGTDYFFHNYAETVAKTSTKAISFATIGDVEITQTLEIVENPNATTKNVVSIRYSCVNKGSEACTIGVRIMLDTMLGSNDGAPFKVNNREITAETEYSGSNIPKIYQAYDSLSNPSLTATGYTYYTASEKPDKVQFAAWPGIRGSSWAYMVDPDRAITGDSAFVSYFNEKTVAAGASRSAVTYYGAYNSSASGKYDSFDFSDETFDYNLALFCAGMSAMAYEGYASVTDSGQEYFYSVEDLNKKDKEKNNRSLPLYNRLKKAAFKDISFYNYNAEEEDKASYCLAHKKVSHNGTVRDLILVTIRGTNDPEWKGNMNVTGYSYNNMSEHYSFQKGATQIESKLMVYMNEHTSISNPMVIITGHSRGGAIGNLLAADLMNDRVTRVDETSVFAYLFAVPNCTTDYDPWLEHVYNFVFQDDFVPGMPLNKNWEYYKHGTVYAQNAENAFSSNGEFAYAEAYCVSKSDGKYPSFDTAACKNVINYAANRWTTVNQFYTKYDRTLYWFMHDVLAPAAIGGLGNGIYLWSHKSDKNFGKIASFFVDGTSMRQSVNDTHQMYTYYNALAYGVFSNQTIYDREVISYMPENVVSMPPASIYIAEEEEPEEEIADQEPAAELLEEEPDDEADYEVLDEEPAVAEEASEEDVYTEDEYSEDEILEEDLPADQEELSFEEVIDTEEESFEITDTAESIGEETVEEPVSEEFSEETDAEEPDDESSDIAGELPETDTESPDESALEEEPEDSAAEDEEEFVISEETVETEAADEELEEPQEEEEETEKTNAEKEQEALLALAEIGDNIDLLEWDLEDCSTWEGITWDEDGRVCAIDFAYFGLEGELDLSAFELVEYVDVSGNSLTSLTLPDSEATVLTFLSCENNLLEELDIAGQPLEFLSCHNNYLDEDAITAAAEGIEDVSVSPQLVKNSTYSAADTAVLQGILGGDPESWFGVKWELFGNTYYATSIDLSNADLAGAFSISGLEQLQSLTVSDNALTSLTVSGCPNLTYLNCAANELTSLSVSGCTLETLACDGNYLDPAVIAAFGAETTEAGWQGSFLSADSIAPAEAETLAAVAEALGQDPSLPGEWDFVNFIDEDGIYYAQKLDLSGRAEFTGTLDLTGMTMLKEIDLAGSGIEEIILPESLTEIPEEAFFGCTALTTVRLSKGVTSIGARAFAECEALTYIVFTNALEEIGDDAFMNDLSLQTAYFTGNAPSIGQDAFIGTSIDFSIQYQEGTTGWDDEAYDLYIPTEFERLMISAVPYRLNYMPGEELDLDGLELRYLTDENTVVTVTEGYNVAAPDMTDPGTQTVQVSFEGHIVSFDITISRISIQNAYLELDNYEYDYTGSPILPQLTVAYNGGPLTEGEDYTVEAFNNTAPTSGNAYYQVTGIGNYQDSVNIYFSIRYHGETVTSSISDLETPHNYYSYSDWFYRYQPEGPEAKSLDVTFDAASQTESGYDYVRILDAEDNEIAQYSGTEMAGLTVNVPGKAVTIRFTSDSSYTDWGFRVSGIVKQMDTAGIITTAGNVDGGVKLAWNAVSGASKYVVYRKKGSSSAWIKLTETTARTYTDKKTAAGTTYRYAVRWIDENGMECVSAAEAAGKAVRYLEKVVPGFTNLSGGIRLKWAASKGATGYKVYRKTGSGSYKLIKTTTALTYTDTAVKNNDGTAYVYAVRAYYGSSLSVTKGLTYVRQKSIAISSAANTAAGKMTVKWAKNTKATGYQIQYSTSSSFASGNKTITITKNTTVSKVIGSLKKGKTYYVRIRKYKTVSGKKYYSAWSAKKTVKITR